MINDITNFIFLRLLLFFLELVLVEGMFLLKSKRRKNFILRFLLSILISCGLIYLMAILNYKLFKASNFSNATFYWINPLSNLILFVLTCLIVGICFDISLRELFSTVVFGYAVKSIAFCIYSLIFTNIDTSLIFLRLNQMNLLNGLLYLGTYSILYIFFYFTVVGRLLNKGALTLDVHIIIVFVFVIVFNIFVASIAETESTNLESMTTYNLTLMSETLTLSLMVVLNSYNQSSNELKIKNMTALAMLEKQETQFKFSKANAELLHIKTHDLKHQVAVLREGGEAAEKVLKELEGVIEDYESVIITENKVLNIILSEKWMYCRKHDIKFSCTVDPKALLDIEPTKLYSLIGNILDNCIEAVMKIKDKKLRYISLVISHEFGVSIIQTKNYFDGVMLIKDGLPETTKNNKDNHGFGIRSIKMITNQLDGSLVFNADENLFTLQITIPDEKH